MPVYIILPLINHSLPYWGSSIDVLTLQVFLQIWRGHGMFTKKNCKDTVNFINGRVQIQIVGNHYFPTDNQHKSNISGDGHIFILLVFFFINDILIRIK